MLSISTAIVPKGPSHVLAVLLTAIFGVGVVRALAEPETRSQESERPADSDPTAKADSGNDSPVEANKILDILLNAARDAKAGVQSASGKAKFIRWMRLADGEEPWCGEGRWRLGFNLTGVRYAKQKHYSYPAHDNVHLGRALAGESFHGMEVAPWRFRCLGRSPVRHRSHL